MTFEEELKNVLFLIFKSLFLFKIKVYYNEKKNKKSYY